MMMRKYNINILKNIQEQIVCQRIRVAAFIRWCNKHHLTMLWGLMLVYRIVLDLLYIFAVNPQYAYAGLTLKPHAIKYILSWFFLICIFYTIPYREMRMASVCLHLQLIFTVMPLLTYYALNDQSTSYMLMVVIVVLLQNWILREKEGECVKVRLLNLKPYIEIFIPIFIIGMVFMALAWNGFHGLAAFDFKFLYAIRNNTSYPPFLPYFLNWVTMALLPFFLAYALHKLKYIYIIIYFLINFILYMIMGNKFIYLSLAIIVGIFILQRLEAPIKLLYAGFIALCLANVVLFLLERGVSGRIVGVIFNAFFGIRFLFVPAQNKFLYYDCFSYFPKALFSDGQIGRLFGFTYPYSGSLGQTAFAWQEPGRLFESNSNTGYLGDSYAQFGFPGMIIMAVLIALLIKFFDRNVSKAMQPVFMIALSVQMVILNDGALLTQLLTGGMWLLIIFAMIYTEPKHGIKTIEISDNGGGGRMNIDYEVKDILFFVLKKWYVIAAFLLCGSLVSIPFANASYKYVAENYIQKTNYDFLLKEEIAKIQKPNLDEPQTALSEKEEQTEAGITAFFEVFVLDEKDMPVKDEIINSVLLNIVRYTKDNLFLVSFLNSLVEQGIEFVDFAAFSENISLEAISGTNYIQMNFYNIRPSIYEAFVGRYPEAITGFLEDTISVKSSIVLSDTLVQEKPAIVITIDEYEQAKQNALIRLKQNKEILREPSIRTEKMKYMTTAGMFSGMIGVFVILCADYVKRAKVLKEKNV